MRRLTAAIVGFVFLFALSASIGIARAATNDVELPAGQTTEGPYIRAGERVTIKGTVNGDVIVAGSEVMIEGTVNGSVYAAGSKVTISGVVTGNTHAAGSEVSYQAKSSGSAFLVGSSIVVQDPAELNTGYFAGSSVDAGGKYTGGLYAAGSQLVVSGQIARDVTLAGTEIRVANSARVGGNVKYTSRTNAAIDNDQAVKGSITRVTPPQQSPSERVVGRLLETLFWLTANLVIAAVWLWFMPGYLRRSESAYMKSPAVAVLKAVGFIFLVPVGLVFGLLTLIGIPLMIILGLAYVLVLLLAPTAAAHWLGMLIWERQQKSQLNHNYQQELAATGLGFLIVAIVNLLPIVGGILSFALFFIGVAILIARGFTPLGYTSKAGASKSRRTASA